MENVLTHRVRAMVVLSGFFMVACQSEPAATPTIPEVHLASHDFGYTLPDTIVGGLVTIDFTNDGPEDHHAQFIRLNDGVTRAQFDSTLDAVMAAVATEGEGAFMRLFDVATVEGGPSIISPGGKTEVTVALNPGEYVLACFIPSPDGVPHIAKGMIRGLTVTAPPETMLPTPVADGTVDMADFAYASIPNMHAGTMTLEVKNSGQEPHEMAILRLDGITMEQLMPMLMGPPPEGEMPAGPPPFTFVGGMQALMPGDRGWVTLDLTPGNYVMLCLIPSPANQGAPHVALGMAKAFSVS